MLRRLVSVAALIGLVAAPAVAETVLVCRHTGRVMVACGESPVPDQPILRDAGCCEQREMATLAPATASGRLALLAPVGAALPVAPVACSAWPSAAAPSAGPARLASGPPIFIAVRSLLI